MVRLVTARNKTRAMAKLSQLLELQNEPIAIAAALSGSFVDMYRVKCGAAAHRNYAAVHKDFSYRGSDYRLRANPVRRRPIIPAPSWSTSSVCCWGWMPR